KFFGFHWKAVAIAGVEVAKWMRSVQQRTQGRIAKCLAVLRAGEVFGLQHFSLTHLSSWDEQRMRKHIEQQKQALRQQGSRHLEEEIGVALAGGGIQLPAAALYERHQALFLRITIATEKQLMLEKMCQPWILRRRIMRTSVYSYQGGGLGTGP